MMGPEKTKDRSLDQIRAGFVWEFLGRETVTSEFKNLAKGAPALIMGSGLMQTLAFYQSKAGKGPHGKLRDCVVCWLGNEHANLGWQQSVTDFKSAMTKLSATDSTAYMHATQEALELLRWVRQFADALARDRE